MQKEWENIQDIISPTHVLETEVIDTGIGINKDR